MVKKNWATKCFVALKKRRTWEVTSGFLKEGHRQVVNTLSGDETPEYQ
jgi:hypothetical protein